MTLLDEDTYWKSIYEKVSKEACGSKMMFVWLEIMEKGGNRRVNREAGAEWVDDNGTGIKGIEVGMYTGRSRD